MEKSLKCLTEEDKQEAFEKIQSTVHIDNRRLVRITTTTTNYLDAALEILANVFIKDEPVFKASGATWSSEYDKILRDIFSQNLSLAILDETTGEMNALFTIEVKSKAHRYPIDELSDKSLNSVFTFCEKCETSGDVFNHFGVDEAFHFSYLVVARKYRKQGVGTQICKAALAFVKELAPCKKVCVKVEGSSNYSQSIFEKFGFETLFEQPYATYFVDGKQVLQDT